MGFWRFASDLAATEFSGNLSHKVITLQGDETISASLGDTTAEKELAELDRTEAWLVMTADLRGPNSVPRVVVSIQFGLANATLTTQNMTPDRPAMLRKRFREWVQSFDQGSVSDFQQMTEGATPSTKSAPGTIIDCYRLIEPLGSGYSAEVWRAEVIKVPPGVGLTRGAEVALKIYKRLMDHSADTIRVQREFQVATSIDHVNLVKVFDLVLSPSRPLHNFLVMELVKGRTLKSAIPRDGMSTVRIARLSRHIFSALNALHVQAALHRDVKAANVMLTGDGDGENAKLCDLGIVSVLGDPALTGTSVFVGSKHSAPLEQMIGDEVDQRADIYAAGSVMFNCYCGRPMYDRAGPEGAIVRRMMTNPEYLTARKDASDEPLVALINRCISVDPAERPATAAEVLAVLERIK